MRSLRLGGQKKSVCALQFPASLSQHLHLAASKAGMCVQLLQLYLPRSCGSEINTASSSLNPAFRIVIWIHLALAGKEKTLMQCFKNVGKLGE